MLLFDSSWETERQTHVRDLGMNNSGHDASLADLLPAYSSARHTVVMCHFQVRMEMCYISARWRLVIWPRCVLSLIDSVKWKHIYQTQKNTVLAFLITDGSYAPWLCDSSRLHLMRIWRSNQSGCFLFKELVSSFTPSILWYDTLCLHGIYLVSS